MTQKACAFSVSSSRFFSSWSGEGQRIGIIEGHIAATRGQWSSEGGLVAHGRSHDPFPSNCRLGERPIA